VPPSRGHLLVVCMCVCVGGGGGGGGGLSSVILRLIVPCACDVCIHEISGEVATWTIKVATFCERNELNDNLHFFQQQQKRLLDVDVCVNSK
jgi:hypothetical protein